MTIQTYAIFDVNRGNTLLPLSMTDAAPVNGTSGTLAGTPAAVPNALLLYNGAIYQNTNTQASPTWTVSDFNAGAVAITGGTIDGTPVGGTTPAAVTGTTVTASGSNGALIATATNAITASTTQTRGQGLLTSQINRITVCANSGDTVTLKNIAVGEWQDVYNDGANPAKVFPNGASDTIDGGTAAASVPLANAKRCRYTKVAANTIISAQLGAVSA